MDNPTHALYPIVGAAIIAVGIGYFAFVQIFSVKPTPQLIVDPSRPPSINPIAPLSNPLHNPDTLDINSSTLVDLPPHSPTSGNEPSALSVRNPVSLVASISPRASVTSYAAGRFGRILSIDCIDSNSARDDDVREAIVRAEKSFGVGRVLVWTVSSPLPT